MTMYLSATGSDAAHTTQGASKMRRLRSGGAALLALAVIAGACGDSKATSGRDKNGGTDSSAPASASGANAAGDAPSTDAGGTTGAKGATGSQAQGGATTTVAPGTPNTGKQNRLTGPPLEAKVTLASPCVKAGGQQSITVEAPPSAAASYDSVYPDGRSGAQDGFYGGNNGRVMDESGRWTDTWTIAPHAPAGKVTVRVQAVMLDHSPYEKELVFDLVPATSSCP